MIPVVLRRYRGARQVTRDGKRWEPRVLVRRCLIHDGWNVAQGHDVGADGLPTLAAVRAWLDSDAGRTWLDSRPGGCGVTATVWPMDEGGVLIKTADVESAKRAYADWLAKEDTCGDEIPVQVERATYREGWYRWTPCSERSCYDHGNHRPGHLQYESGPGRGVWRGVAVNCS